MMYAFARDGGIPGHKFFAKVSTKRRSPIRTGIALQLYQKFSRANHSESMACMYP